MKDYPDQVTRQINTMLTKSQVKYIQTLNEKKFRKEEGVFIAEGPKIINELLASINVQPVALYGTEDWWKEHAALKDNLPFAACHELRSSELERISFLTTPHQVLGVFKVPTFPALSFKNTVTILLDSIRDPGNMGTIVRIADWFGVKQIVASRDSADVFNPKVIQSTMGSIARVKISYEDIEAFVKEHKNIPVYASTLNGKPLVEFGKVKEGLLLVGNESRGISEELINAATHQLTIPRFGQAESLNAAVATGIILSHIF